MPLIIIAGILIIYSIFVITSKLKFGSLLAIFACVNCFKIEESAKTKRILQYIKNHSAVIEEQEQNHWHDKYEHDLYNNV